MDLISFKRVGDEVYADKQMVHTFFVSRTLYEKDSFEVMPLTLGNLAYALIRNYAVILSWRLARIAKRARFLRTPDNCVVSWRQDWHWKFWK